MSKSKGNVVNPDEMVKQYGSDVLRMYILFMGPPELDCEWQDAGLEGIKRFVNRLWNYLTDQNTIISGEQDEKVTRRFHIFLKKYQERLQFYKPNTALSALMEWLNDATAHSMKLDTPTVEKLLVAISVMAPHFAAELLEKLLGKKLSECTWPLFDPVWATEDTATIVVQINGKMRANISVAKGADLETVRPLAEEAVAKWLALGSQARVIFVKDRLINFVVEGA